MMRDDFDAAAPIPIHPEFRMSVAIALIVSWTPR
jgi:hypothetical protein